MSRLALISCLPPHETGVAAFTHQLLREAPEAFRAYALPSVRRSFVAGNLFEPARWAVRALDRLNGDVGRDVDAVVIMLGNSEHFTQVFSWARTWRPATRDVPRLLYLHDAYLFSLLGFVPDSDGFLRAISEDHGRAIAHPHDHAEVRQLVRARVLGAAAVIRAIQPDGVLVNSLSARDMLRAEPGFPAEILVETLYHPVFPGRAVWRPRGQSLAPRIGSFGVPTPFKDLELLLGAFEQLQEHVPAATLVLAGYGVTAWAALHGLAGRRGVELHGAPHRATLDALMASVNLAVQLRETDLGESSGIVADLLAIGTPLLLSPRGAGLEIGSAATFTGEAPTAEDLEALIRRELESPTDRREDTARYVREHSVRAFADRLREIAAALRR